MWVFTVTLLSIGSAHRTRRPYDPPVLPRAVATDLDGTLLRSDGTLDDRTLRALQDV
jgi:hypothetical protein